MSYYLILYTRTIGKKLGGYLFHTERAFDNLDEANDAAIYCANVLKVNVKVCNNDNKLILEYSAR